MAKAARGMGPRAVCLEPLRQHLEGGWKTGSERILLGTNAIGVKHLRRGRERLDHGLGPLKAGGVALPNPFHLTPEQGVACPTLAGVHLHPLPAKRAMWLACFRIFSDVFRALFH